MSHDSWGYMISIHSLRVEGDVTSPSISIPASASFQSTPSVWRETKLETIFNCDPQFQSTPSVWRETFGFRVFSGNQKFQSTPSVWRETKGFGFFDATSDISIHSLRVEGDKRLDKVLRA